MGQRTRSQVHFGGLGVAVGTGMVGGLIGQGWNRVSVLDGTWRIGRETYKEFRDIVRAACCTFGLAVIDTLAEFLN